MMSLNWRLKLERAEMDFFSRKKFSAELNELGNKNPRSNLSCLSFWIKPKYSFVLPLKIFCGKKNPFLLFPALVSNSMTSSNHGEPSIMLLKFFLISNVMCESAKFSLIHLNAGVAITTSPTQLGALIRIFFALIICSILNLLQFYNKLTSSIYDFQYVIAIDIIISF